MAQDAAARANADAALSTPAAVVLGVGADGHTASLFADAPQWEVARTTQQRYVALQPGAAPHARVGLSLQALSAQQRCYVWSSGAAKLEALSRARTIAEDAAQGRGDPARLFNAGPIALLIADPRAALHVFHAEP
jgi:6-phosphogluconolactonase